MALNWNEIVTILGGQTIFLAAVAWLIKALLSPRLALEVEAFKAKLQVDADSQIERLRGSLQMAALEHQVRFSRLHEMRAKVIAQLYARLLEAERAGAQYVLLDAHHADEAKREKGYSAALETVREFYIFAAERKIYFPGPIFDTLEALLKKMRLAVIGVDIYGRIKYPTPQTQDQKNKTFEEAFDAFEQDIPKLTRDLEGEFRKILGVEMPPVGIDAKDKLRPSS